jgi:hypothetical protein
VTRMVARSPSRGHRAPWAGDTRYRLVSVSSVMLCVGVQSPALRGSGLSAARRLVLTDEQLDQIMRCSAPLHPRIRRVFVELVACALRGKVIGDGEVWRTCATVLRESAC